MLILYVEDEDHYRKEITGFLEKNHYEVIDTGNPLKAIDIVKNKKIDLILSDYRMKEMNGYEFMMEVKKINPFVKFVMITGVGDVDIAVKSMKSGAEDYIKKPFKLDILHKKIKEIQNKIHTEDQISNIQKLERKEQTIDNDFSNIVGKSRSLRKVLSKIPKVARTTLPVLILGESGTGKELIADLVQSLSNRKDKPFVKVNSAAIPSDLLESELFGYEKGSFTGANKTKVGKIEYADEGTIFLDEIGEMPYTMQGKLLRFLQNKEIQRIGSTHPLKIDVRVIAATNKDLEQLVKEKEFREDLYYRLNTVILDIPPLRERKEDILLLIDHFVDKYSKMHNLEKKSFVPEAKDILIKHSYPGNIRELENLIQYTMLFSTGKVIFPEDIPISFEKREDPVDKLDLPDSPISLKNYIEDIEKEIIMKHLDKTGWNQSKAADNLEISEFTLRYKMKKYGIKKS
jgi:two-component system NtrC family response regulator